MEFSEINRLYDDGFDLSAWGRTNTPGEDLIWRKGVDQQIQKIEGVAAVLPGTNDPPRVVGSHTSKSVKLPVTCFRFNLYNQVEAYAFVRDNFHNIKVVVISDSPIHMPYELVHAEWSQERYDEEVKSFREYTGGEVSDTDDWYREWSSGSILRKDGRIYRAGSHQKVYCEGIDDLGLPDDVFKPYEEGSQGFVCEIGSYATVAMILEHVVRSLEQERYRRWEKEREVRDDQR